MPLGIGIEHIEIVVGIVRLQGGLDGGLTGVGDGRGRQALVGIQVIGAVQGLIVVLGDLPPGGIHQGGVDLQQMGRLAHVLQPVVDHGGDQRAVGAVGLLLDQGGHDDDLLQTVGGVGDQRRQLRIVHDAVLEVGQQAAQSRVGIFLHIELRLQ